MTPLTIARLTLLLVGVGFFTYSMRTNEAWARYVAIGVLVAAIVVRFLDRNRYRRR